MTTPGKHQHRWQPYLGILSYAALFVFFMVLDTFLYYGYGRHHSKVPFLLFGLLTLIVLILATMAAYQTYRHRHDADPW